MSPFSYIYSWTVFLFFPNIYILYVRALLIFSRILFLPSFLNSINREAHPDYLVLRYTRVRQLSSRTFFSFAPCYTGGAEMRRPSPEHSSSRDHCLCSMDGLTVRQATFLLASVSRLQRDTSPSRATPPPLFRPYHLYLAAPYRSDYHFPPRRASTLRPSGAIPHPSFDSKPITCLTVRVSCLWVYMCLFAFDRLSVLHCVTRLFSVRRGIVR